jgi:hypothetical protein
MTKLDSICEIIAALEFPEDDAEKLLAAIAEYRATRGSSYKRLMRISGFAKLWDAIEESRESLCPDAAALTRRSRAARSGRWSSDRRPLSFVGLVNGEIEGADQLASCAASSAVACPAGRGRSIRGRAESPSA